MMYSVIQTTNKDLIKKLLSIDDTYDSLVYDGSPQLMDYNVDVTKCFWFILMKDRYTSGLIKLDYLNYVLWVPHIFIYEKYRGRGSEQWGKLVAEQMFTKYGAKKFLALTPYITAKKYAEKVGFKLIGTLEKSVQKNGELMDQYMLELDAQSIGDKT